MSPIKTNFSRKQKIVYVFTFLALVFGMPILFASNKTYDNQNKKDISEFMSAVLSDSIDKDSTMNDGTTALMIASQNGDIKTVIYLMGKKVDMNKRDSAGQTALMHATLKGQFEVVKKLVEKYYKGNIDVWATDKNGWTALMLAAKIRNIEIMKILFDTDEPEIDINKINKHREPALAIAKQYGCKECMSILKLCDFCSLTFWGSKYLGGWPIINERSVNYTEQLSKFIKHDFSNLWTKNQDSMLGYVGNNYQRFLIHFNEIKKSEKSPFVYLINGKTRVQNIIENFVGEITISHIYEMSAEDFNAGGEWQYGIDWRSIKRYFLMGKFSFQKSNGDIISGSLGSFFYLKNNKIFYDDLENYSDNYANNLFVGTIKDSKTDVTTKCNFGNFRIPYSGDLDLGAGDFYPNEKYHKNGWENYAEALGTYYKNPSEKAKKARAEENREWWK